MNLKKIEDEAMHLSEQERAQLIQKLVLSLDTPSEDELKADWLKAAKRRSEELDEGIAQAVSGEDVMKKARTLLR